MENTLETFVEQVEDFLTQTADARFLSERDRDYKDNIQYTEEERKVIEKRWQAAVTINRIKPKVEGLKGLLIQRKTDPKAFPRTKKHEKAANAITDALRYVSDNTRFNKVKLEVADNVFVEGYGAAITEIREKGNEVEITCHAIPWDRYYFDYHSRRLDFADRRWDGIVVWMDIEVAKEAFDLSDDEAEEILADSSSEFIDDTFEDRPTWVDKTNKRVRVCQHFYIKNGEWWTCYFTSNKMLIEPEKSQYLDEEGRPTNPIEAITANIDRENNRFGEVRYWIDLQDEINHRRSKFLHLLSQRQTMGRRGAIQDIAALKRELAKPDGHVEYDGDKDDFQILRTNDMADGQFTLLEEAKRELDAIGFNAQLSGERQGDLSGKAILNLQQAATNELSSLYENLIDWENRIYTQWWWRIRQYWNEEKWLRVLDDRTNIRWVGLNQKVKYADILKEQAQDESLPLDIRMQAQTMLAQMMQVQHPALNQIVEVRNPVSELDIDIIIESSYDLVNIQREQFELIGKIAQTRPEVPFTEVLKLSELRDKDRIIENIEAQAQQAQQAQQQFAQEQQKAAQMESQSKAVMNAAKANTEQVEAAKKQAETEQTMVQTELMLEQGVKDPAVVI